MLIDWFWGFIAISRVLDRDTKIPLCYESDRYTLNIWDVGGQRTIRSYWRNYFEQTDGLVWVVDSSDLRRLDDCKMELDNLLKEEVGAILVLCYVNHSCIQLWFMLGCLPLEILIGLPRFSLHWFLSSALFSCSFTGVETAYFPHSSLTCNFNRIIWRVCFEYSLERKLYHFLTFEDKDSSSCMAVPVWITA